MLVTFLILLGLHFGLGGLEMKSLKYELTCAGDLPTFDVAAWRRMREFWQKFLNRSRSQPMVRRI